MISPETLRELIEHALILVGTWLDGPKLELAAHKTKAIVLKGKWIKRRSILISEIRRYDLQKPSDIWESGLINGKGTIGEQIENNMKLKIQVKIPVKKRIPTLT